MSDFEDEKNQQQLNRNHALITLFHDPLTWSHTNTYLNLNEQIALINTTREFQSRALVSDTVELKSKHWRQAYTGIWTNLKTFTLVNKVIIYIYICIIHVLSHITISLRTLLKIVEIYKQQAL